MAENENPPTPKTELVEEHRSMTTTLIEAGATLAASVVGPYATVKFMKQGEPKDPPRQEPPNQG